MSIALSGQTEYDAYKLSPSGNFLISCGKYFRQMRIVLKISET
jgi:hypothetical protein